jgi:predicted nucleic acid-binding protein
LIIVDTDILVDVLRGRAEASHFLDRLASGDVLRICSVTRMELIVGCQNKVGLREVNQLLDSFDEIHINEVISRRAVRLIETYYLSHGLLIADAFIAAAALVTGAPLATKNQKHFGHIDGLTFHPYPKIG